MTKIPRFFYIWSFCCIGGSSGKDVVVYKSSTEAQLVNTLIVKTIMFADEAMLIQSQEYSGWQYAL